MSMFKRLKDRLSYWRYERDKLRAEIADLRYALGSSEDRVKIADEARASAVQQLTSERSLRERAESTADRYHAELVAALKQTANHSSRLSGRRSVFPDVEPAVQSDDRADDRTNQLQGGKRMARDVANAGTHQTLEEMYKRILAETEAPAG